MTKDPKSRPKRFKRSFLYLTLLLIGLIVTRPVLPPAFAGHVFALVMIVSAWVVSAEQRRTRLALGLLSFPAVGALLTDMLFPSVAGVLFQGFLKTFILASTVLLFVYCGIVILLSLVRKETVTADDVLGAVSLYIMTGFTWAFFYTLTEVYIPGSFSGLSHQAATVGGEGNSDLLFEFIYFSFVTLATQGYGDITAHGSVAQMLVILETIIGPLYLALVLAYMLSVHITQRMNGK